MSIEILHISEVYIETFRAGLLHAEVQQWPSHVACKSTRPQQDMKFTPKDYSSKLPLPATTKWPEGVWDLEAFRHGSMSLIFYAPKGYDYQTPHDQDELYVVIKGSGTLEIEGEPIEFAAGDVLFVPAHRRHRFIKFDGGIEMWAVFYGAVGGEASA